MKIKFLIFFLLVFIPVNIIAQENLYLQAKVSSENKQYEKAVKMLTSYLSDYPGDNKALFLRAQSNLELRNYQLVITDLAKIKITYQKDILLMLARSNAGLRKDKLAIEQLDKYLGSSKKLSEPMVQSYIEFHPIKGTKAWESLWVNERYTKKEQLLNNAIYAIKSKRYAEAKDRLDELIGRYNRSHEGLYLRGKLYFNNEDYSMAMNDFEAAITLKDDKIDYKCALARCYAKVKKGKKAILKFNEIINKDPLYIDAYLGRAEAYLVNNDFDNAQTDIEKFRAYYPSNIEAQYLNAAINVKSGDFLNAISTYGKLIKSDPAKPEYFIGRAKSYMATKTFKYAIKDFSMALDLDPKNVEVYKLKAIAHRENGEIEKACAEWKYAAKLGDTESMDNFKKYCK